LEAINSRLLLAMSKVFSGQSQLLIPLIVILISALVFATNTYMNATNSSTPSGLFMGTSQTKESSFSIDVWADTSIRLDSDEKFIRAVLFLDDGTLLKDQQVDFYLNESSIGNVLTNPEGVAKIPRTENGTIRAVFNGNGFLFLKPSQGEIEAINVINVTNLTENLKTVSYIISNKANNLGNLEITVSNISEDSYKTLELDENYQRIEKKYYKVYIKVFNNFSRASGIYSLEDNEVIKVSLEDNLGNLYKQNDDVTFFLSSPGLFGNSMEILPSNSREGYLIFPETTGIPEKLIVEIKSGEEAEFRLI
jgi:hypothetical protein